MIRRLDLCTDRERQEHSATAVRINEDVREGVGTAKQREAVVFHVSPMTADGRRAIILCWGGITSALLASLYPLFL